MSHGAAADVRGWLLSLLLPAAGITIVLGLVVLLTSLRAVQVHGLADIAGTAFLTLLPIGLWLHRELRTRAQRLAAAAAPLAYLALWLATLDGLEHQGTLLRFTPLEYLMGLAPLLGLVAGFAVAAGLRRLRVRV